MDLSPSGKVVWDLHLHSESFSPGCDHEVVTFSTPLDEPGGSGQLSKHSFTDMEAPSCSSWQDVSMDKILSMGQTLLPIKFTNSWKCLEGLFQQLGTERESTLSSSQSSRGHPELHSSGCGVAADGCWVKEWHRFRDQQPATLVRSWLPQMLNMLAMMP